MIQEEAVEAVEEREGEQEQEEIKKRKERSKEENNEGDNKRQTFDAKEEEDMELEAAAAPAPVKDIISLIVSTHGNYVVVGKDSQLQIKDFGDLLPAGSSRDDFTIWTWTFMPILGNPATHIKETMDLMYLCRKFFLGLFSLGLAEESFNYYIQQAQYIVSQKYMSMMIPQIFSALKTSYDELLFNINELLYDATRDETVTVITSKDLFQIAEDIRNNSEKLKDFLNNLLAFQDPTVVKDLMWFIKTDRDNRSFLLKEFTTDSHLLEETDKGEYSGSGQNPWDIVMTYKDQNEVLFGNIGNSGNNKGKKSKIIRHHSISNQALIKQVISKYPNVRDVFIIDASCAHLQQKNRNALVDKFIIAKEQELIDRLFSNKITMTLTDAARLSKSVNQMLDELQFSSLERDCKKILHFITELRPNMPLIKSQMPQKLQLALTNSNIASMTFFTENSILLKKGIDAFKKSNNPPQLKRSSTFQPSSASNNSSFQFTPMLRKSTSVSSSKNLLLSIAGVEEISNIAVRTTEVKLDKLLAHARASTRASASASADELGGSKHKRSKRRKHGSKKKIKNKAKKTKKRCKKRTKRRIRK